MHPKQIVSDVCSETFQESWQFEVHLESHEQTKDNKCDICGKTFFLEWRLKQHMNVHTNPQIRNCHYFNNKCVPFMQLDVNLNILILNFAVVQKAVKLNFAPRNTNQIKILYNEFKCY